MNAKGAVLFLDTVHPVLWDSLETDGFHCEADYHCNKAELIEKIGGYVGIVVRSRLQLTSEILEHAHQLVFIARSGSGLENIDVEYAESRGISCLNSPEGNRDAVGEHAVALLLALLNHIPSGDREVREGKWEREKNRGLELGSMTVGIVGYGNTGSAFAQKLRGFGCRILAFDKYREKFGNEWVEEVGLETIFQEADVLSLHLPYNEETHYLANALFFRQFRNPLYVINTSRGKVLHTEEMVHLLQEGKIVGAGIDVLEYESHSFENLRSDELPPPFQFLRKSEKVVLSPHVAGWTVESYYKLSSVLLDKIRSLNL